MEPVEPNRSAPDRSKGRSCLGTALIVLAGLAVLAIVTFTIGYVLIRRSVNTQLDAAIAEADRLDPGWRLAEIDANRFEPPDGENSAEIVLDVLDQLPPGWPGEEAQGLMNAVDQGGPRTALRLEVAEALRNELEALDPALELARTLADAGSGRFELIRAVNVLETALPHLQESRTLSRLLQLDAARLADEGEMAASIDSIRAILGASRAIGDEPIIISQLVRMAIDCTATAAAERSLGQGEASDEAIESLQVRLIQGAADPLLLHALRGERANFDDMGQKLANGQLNFADLSGSGGGPRPAGGAPPAFHMALYADYNRTLMITFLTRAVEITKQPLHEQAALWEVFEDDVKPTGNPILNLSGSLTYLVMPSIQFVWIAHRRTTASLNAAVVMLACERYRMAEGDWPDPPDDLSPYLPGGLMPLDPYTGDPIRLLRLDDGLACYALGRDLTDDGALFDDRRTDDPGFDLGFRLWNPELRRQPPETSGEPVEESF